MCVCVFFFFPEWLLIHEFSFVLLLGNEAFQFIGGLGLVINMIIYLKSDYHMGTAPATTFLFLWNALGNFLPLLGAFISDSYLGRFQSIVWGSIANLIVSSLHYYNFYQCYDL